MKQRVRWWVVLAAIVVAWVWTCVRPARAEAQRIFFATVVSADTGGVAYGHGPDSLWVWNTTWAGPDSAPAAPECAYWGASQRMLARDSMHLVLTTRSWRWERTLRTGESVEVGATAAFGRWRLTLLDVSAPRSTCGVNAGQLWFHWVLDPADQG